MAETFGARLRQRRERQQIALASIAEQTKISVSLLEGLERDDMQRWPTGIFGRSFVRSYAHAIGLDPDAVVREFLALYPDPAAMIEPVVALSSARADSGSQTPPTRLRYLIERAIDAIPGHRVDRSVPAIGISNPQTACSPSPTLQQPDLMAVADLCTELARVTLPQDLPPLLERAATVLDAVGLIVWVWDPHRSVLRPALAHGYPDALIAHLPGVKYNTDNATATAFRAGEPRIVHSTATESGALVVPVMTPAGCGGVLAIELRNGRERSEIVLALATIFAAQLATLVGFVPVPKAVTA